MKKNGTQGKQIDQSENDMPVTFEEVKNRLDSLSAKDLYEFFKSDLPKIDSIVLKWYAQKVNEEMRKVSPACRSIAVEDCIEYRGDTKGDFIVEINPLGGVLIGNDSHTHYKIKTPDQIRKKLQMI